MEIIINHVSYKEILKNIYIEFDGSKINGIVGPNGSGKTILSKIISGQKKLSKGNIKVGSLSIDEKTSKEELKKYKSKIGYLEQNVDNQLLEETVYQVLENSILNHKYRISEKEKRIDDVFKMLELSDNIKEYKVEQLNYTDKKKIALASILLYNPKILILDDPVLGMDLCNQKNFIKIIRILKQKYKKSIFIISNDCNFINKIVDDIYVLQNGELVLQGPKIEIFKQVRLLKKYGIKSPYTIEFSDFVLNKKKIKLGYRIETNDLIKDIYRNV